MKKENELPESIRNLPKDQQAKALLHAAIAGKMISDASVKKTQEDLLSLFKSDKESSTEEAG